MAAEVFVLVPVQYYSIVQVLKVLDIVVQERVKQNLHTIGLDSIVFQYNPSIWVILVLTLTTRRDFEFNESTGKAGRQAGGRQSGDRDWR